MCSERGAHPATERPARFLQRADAWAPDRPCRGRGVWQRTQLGEWSRAVPELLAPQLHCLMWATDSMLNTRPAVGVHFGRLGASVPEKCPPLAARDLRGVQLPLILESPARSRCVSIAPWAHASSLCSLVLRQQQVGCRWVHPFRSRTRSRAPTSTWSLPAAPPRHPVSARPDRHSWTRCAREPAESRSRYIRSTTPPPPTSPPPSTASKTRARTCGPWRRTVPTPRWCSADTRRAQP